MVEQSCASTVFRMLLRTAGGGGGRKLSGITVFGWRLRRPLLWGGGEEHCRGVLHAVEVRKKQTILPFVSGSEQMKIRGWERSCKGGFCRGGAGRDGGGGGGALDATLRCIRKPHERGEWSKCLVWAPFLLTKQEHKEAWLSIIFLFSSLKWQPLVACRNDFAGMYLRTGGKQTSDVCSLRRVSH